jgi:uncharacterized protein YbjT (DUF2867 family)
MRVAVVGGTGTVGALVVTELAARGNEVRVVSRRPAPAHSGTSVSHHSADIATGEGLIAALDGVEAVVDAVNELRRARNVLIDGTRRLLEAEVAAGVRHHVAISIVGCDRVPLAYYNVKVQQEEAVEAGPVPWSMLRATQFHTLLDGIFARAARFHVAPRGAARFQPVDPGVVAVRIAEAVHAGPAGRVADVAGPEVHTLSELADAWRASGGTRRRTLPLRVPSLGKAGRAMRAGGLCEPTAAAGGATFVEWLEMRRAMRAERGLDTGA